MKDTFKKLGKDALNSAKAEVNNSVNSVKSETNLNISSANGTSFGEKLVKKSIGAGDLLKFVDFETSNSYLRNFVISGETVYYYLESVEEEIAITNFGIIVSSKKSIATSKTVLKRINFKSNVLTELHVETAGTIDLDAELKFKIGDEKLSWDIQKSQLSTLFELYKKLFNVSKAQLLHEQQKDNLNTSLSLAASSVRAVTNTSTTDDFKSITEYAEHRLNDMIVYDYTSSFEEE